MTASYIPPSLIFTLVAATVTSLSFRKHEPNIFAFLAICSSVTIIHIIYYIAQGKNDYLHIGRLAFIQLTIYLSSLVFLVLEYRLSSRHPLARYPGPLLARATKWYMAYQVFSGTRHATLQRLHREMGPWVRIGPNELSINDADAVRPIYLNLSRASSYRGVPAHDETLIMIVDRHRHSSRRKTWTRAFSSKMLRHYIPAANTRAQQLAHTLLGRKSADLHSWISLCLMDLIGDLAFSGGIESLAVGKDSTDWMGMLNLGALVVGVLGQVPWLTKLVLLLPQKGPIESFHQFAKEKVEAARKKDNLDSDCAGILSTILNGGGISTSSPPLSEGEAAADASLLMASSIETTSQALTVFFRYVLADESILRRLRDEIDNFLPSMEGKTDIDPKDTQKMVFLDACIQEALRIMPPAPAGLPRSSGAEGCIINGQYIAPETTVHVPTYTLQRDPDNFVHSNHFMPSRWIPSERTSGPHNDGAYIPFGVGFGACVGQQLALQNIRIIAIHLLSQLDIKFSPDLSLECFDASYKDRNLWTHSEFLVDIAQHRRNSQSKEIW